MKTFCGLVAASLFIAGAAFAGLASSPLGFVVATPGSEKPVTKGAVTSPMGAVAEVVVPMAPGEVKVISRAGVVKVQREGAKNAVVFRPTAKGVEVRTAPGDDHVKVVKPRQGKPLRLIIGRTLAESKRFDLSVGKAGFQAVPK